MNRRILKILLVVLLLIIVWIAFCGYQWSWGPFARLYHLKTARHPGNSSEYALREVHPMENSPLEGKRIVFLGSSVTYGASSGGISFADYIPARNKCDGVKETVSGTTLVDNGAASYISRLKKLSVPQADLFVCQLSTNDAAQKKPLGAVSPSQELSAFDTSTVAGAIEYIIAYAKETWNCPVVFYTNPKYDSTAYRDMVALLPELAEKWEITVIDLWNDDAFNNIAEEQRTLYMADAIHPTQAGYLEWWTPVMEQQLYELFAD